MSPYIRPGNKRGSQEGSRCKAAVRRKPEAYMEHTPRISDDREHSRSLLLTALSLSKGRWALIEAA